MYQISTELRMDTIIQSPNIAEHLSEQELSGLGKHLVQLFDMDRQSRQQWEEKMEKASKIALQVVEKKSFPWPDASNVKFPLLTIAALQYHSRAYPALVDTPDLVECAVVGDDPQGQKKKAAESVSEHMSWQLTEEDEAWEEQTDKALIVQPIMGCVFKKSYFSRELGHNVSEMVLPQDFVVSYYTKSLEKCPRATHILSWSHNDLAERIRRGTILETSTDTPRSVPVPFGKLQELADKSQGLQVVSDDPDQSFIILEMHTHLDLDGDDYQEPYVIWIRYDTCQVLRIAPRFLPSGLKYEKVKGEEVLVRIEPESFFTKIPFIPSPDGGFYDLGFGHLLGPLNESIDTAINQLFDAGTMHNAGGGFLGRGAKIKSGDTSFRPNEWKRVDATGDDLRKSIVELPRREPSPVLFSLLSLLIDYGQRVAGAPDMVQGQNPGQNTPAETSRTMMEQGIKVFSGIYKRTYRALKEEYRKLYRLNQLYLEESQEFNSSKSGLPMKVLKDYYQLPSSVIRPAADPNYMSDAQRLNQAMALVQLSSQRPGFNQYEVNKLYLQALRVGNIEQICPDPKGPNALPPPVNPKLQIEQLKAQQAQMQMQVDMKVKLMELLEEHDLNVAKIHKLEAEAQAALAGIQEGAVNSQMNAINTALGMAKLQHEAQKEKINLLRDLIKMAHERTMANDERRMDGMAGASGNQGVLPSPSSSQTK